MDRERPILMNGFSVRQILAGAKFQTRRVIKPRIKNAFGYYPGESFWVGEHPGGGWWAVDDPNGPPSWMIEDQDLRKREGFPCPYGKIGDCLWIRETFSINDRGQVLMKTTKDELTNLLNLPDVPIKWRPSIHMPKWASRITLEITDIRVERVQDITEEDARQEGIINGGCLNCGEDEPCGCSNPQPDARDSFIWLWDSINAKRGYRWSENPWVWCISFRAKES